MWQMMHFSHHFSHPGPITIHPSINPKLICPNHLPTIVHHFQFQAVWHHIVLTSQWVQCRFLTGAPCGFSEDPPQKKPHFIVRKSSGYRIPSSIFEGILFEKDVETYLWKQKLTNLQSCFFACYVSPSVLEKTHNLSSLLSLSSFPIPLVYSHLSPPLSRVHKW